MNKITRGNGKTNHRTHYYKKTIATKNASECSSEKVMRFRLLNKMIIKICPDTCDFFEKCIAKSGEVLE